MIDPKKVAEKYNLIKEVWDENDKWHLWTKHNIDLFIKRSVYQIPNYQNLRILNAGSAGYSYDLPENNITHIDIADKKIAHLPNSIVCDIQNSSLKSSDFEIVMCVGSVINYCDPIKVINELTRVLKPGGYLLLEFENSYTLELLGKNNFNKKAALIDSFHNGQEEKLWFFSESYIRELLLSSSFKEMDTYRFHILSPLLYRFFKNENKAARFSKFDMVCRSIPVLNKFSSNTIFLFRKSLC